MEEPKISDIPSIKKTLEDIRNLAAAKKAMPLLRPFLRLLRIDIDSMDKVFAEVGSLVRQAEELATIPDRFNDLFSARGWIIYDTMNLEVTKDAIIKAELSCVPKQMSHTFENTKQ